MPFKLSAHMRKECADSSKLLLSNKEFQTTSPAIVESGRKPWHMTNLRLFFYNVCLKKNVETQLS